MFKQIIIGSIVLTLVLLTFSVVSDGPPKENPFKIIQILPKSHEDNKIIVDLGKKYFVDFWSHPSYTLGVVTALVNEVTNKDFIEGLKQNKIEYKLEETDSLVTRIQKQLSRKTTSRVGEKFDYDNTYHTLEQIYQELDRLAKAYPNRLSVQSIGQTYEKRDIKVVKLFGNELKKRIVVLECGIHAREWLSQAFCMWAINKLVDNHRLLGDYDFVIIPVLNPDGYQWTWKDWKSTEDFKTWPENDWFYVPIQTRFWRKNREPNPNTTEYYPNPPVILHGGIVDMPIGKISTVCFDTKEFCNNDFQGVSNIPVHDVYCGSKPMRALEVKALSEYLISIKDKMVAYFNFHTHALQSLLYPRGYTNQSVPNAEYLKMLSNKAVTAIAKVHGIQYEYGTGPDLMYYTSGSSDDWIYDSLHVGVVFTIEMRPKSLGRYQGSFSGFAPDESEIKPNSEEVFAGVEAVLDQMTYNENHKSDAAVEADSGGLSTQGMASIITITVILISASILLFI